VIGEIIHSKAENTAVKTKPERCLLFFIANFHKAI
jgi:hypothetical protein